MKWPFVSRGTHDALMAAKDAKIALDEAQMTFLSRMCDLHEGRYNALRERHDAFVALVAERTAPVPKPLPPEKRETDAVDTAIQWVAGDDRAKRRYLEGWAKRERKAGKDVATIAAAIMDGDRVSDDSDDDDGIPG